MCTIFSSLIIENLTQDFRKILIDKQYYDRITDSDCMACNSKVGLKSRP